GLADREAPPIDWQDLFYWEQRIGVWLADIEQSLDLSEAPSFQPVNGALFYTLLLLHRHRDGTLQRSIIRSRLAGLLQIPVNPDLGSRRSVFRSIARLLTYVSHEATTAGRIM